MTTVKAFRWGKALFVGLWLVGLTALAATVGRMVPGGPLAACGIVLGLCITIAIGVTSQRCGFFARPILRVEGAGDRLALTFDDGPDPEFTPRVLELLGNLDQRATFFVIGDKVAHHPALVRRIVEEGHQVANHTMGHAWHMPLWPDQRVAADLARTSDLVEEVVGARPTLFRPPAAMLSPRIAAGARAAGLRLVGFSTRAGDGSPVVSAGRALQRLVRGLRPGAILVLHDNTVAGRAPTSLEVLPPLCAEMKQRGLRSVTLSELLV